MVVIFRHTLRSAQRSDTVPTTMTTGTEKGSQKIVMLGLGHVGLTLALALADVGFEVLGYDIKADIRDKTRRKISHFKERGLAELLEAHVGKNFTIIDTLEPSSEARAYFVTVGTPFNFDNTPDYTFIKSAAHDLGKIIRKGDLIILRSTVPMGTTRDVVTPIVEQVSGLRVGADFGIAFAPERTVEGNAFEELRTLPQIVGGYDEVSLARTRALFERLTTTIVSLPTLEEAEMVKLVNNTYRETVFAYANQVSMLARAWGVDTKRVITAANTGYARSQVPFPSPGVGGYCLTKDAYLFMESARKKSVDTRLLRAVRENSSTMLDVLADSIRVFAKEHFPKRVTKVGVLGFAFKGKPQTSDVRGSSTQALIKRFTYERKQFEFFGFDPLVESATIEKMGAQPMDSIESLIKTSDITIIMNNNPAFETINLDHFKDVSGKHLLFDTWGVCGREEFEGHPNVIYWTL